MKYLGVGIVLCAINLMAWFSKDKMNSMDDYNFPTYEKEWKKIEENLKSGLYKSALPEIESVLQKSISDKNYPQQYKAILYLEKYQAYQDKNDLRYTITRLEKRLENADARVKALLHSVLATMYFQLRYFGRYDADKTDIEGEEQDKDDILTWSTAKWIEKSNQHALASLEFPETKTAKLEDYQAILYYKNDEHLQPSLYDVLAYRAIQHFSQNETDLTLIPNQSYPKEKLWGSIEDFLSLEIPADQNNMNRVLKIFQVLMSNNKNSKHEEALLYVNLKRIEFVRRLSSGYKDAAAILGLYDRTIQKFSSSNFISKYPLSLAEWIIQQAYTDEIKKLTNNTPKVFADSICKDLVIHAKDESVKSQAKSMSASLHSSFLTIVSENAQLPEQAFRIKLDYRNVKKLRLKLIQLTEAESMTAVEFRHDTEKMGGMLEKKAIAAWSQDLPSETDLEQHSIELKVDAQKIGQYILLVEQLDENNTNVKAKFFQLIQITNLAFSTSKTKQNSQSIYIQHRKYGSPVEAATVSFYKYNYQGRNKSNIEESEKFQSSAEGRVDYNHENYYLIKLKQREDIYYSQFNTIYGMAEFGDVRENTVFFTDRSIYRPGQKVQFKTLTTILKRSNTMPDLVPNKSLRIKCLDVNGQEVFVTKLTTNSFGSASAEFILPKNLLSGDFNLVAEDNSYHSFKVEEYKRPAFEVLIDTIREAYKIGDQVNISGNAANFSGVQLDNAKVRYRVVRNEFNICTPVWCTFYPGYGKIGNLAPIEIAHGETVTDDNGQFSIDFKAEAPENKSFDRGFPQNYRYHIMVDVLDQNGETQSGESEIMLSSNPFLMKSNLNFYQLQSGLDNFKLEALNLNQIQIPQKFFVEIYSLVAPQQFLRNRQWNQPDRYLFSKEEYKKYFPHDIYADENDPSKWNVQKLVWKTNTAAIGMLEAKLADVLSSGPFKLVVKAEATANSEILHEDYFYVIDASSKLNHLPPLVLNDTGIKSPGQKLNLYSPGTDQKFHHLFYIGSLQNANTSWKVQTPEFHSQLIGESDRGGMQWQSVCIYENSLFTYSGSIEVPWSNKKLNIITKSFRQNLLPGQKEHWSFKIDQPSDKFQTVEIAAAMYDASLDKIYPHSWTLDVFPYCEAPLMQPGIFGLDYFNTISENYTMDSYNYTPQSPSELKLFEILDYYNYATPRSRNVQMKETAAPGSADILMSGKREERMADASGAAEVKPDESVKPRKNLSETVFFFPEIRTDKNSEFSLDFTMGESLTKWKLQILAHTEDLKYGIYTTDIVTSKPIQIFPNYPRFLRQGDKIELSAKVSNVSDKAETGKVKMDILDAITEKVITSELKITGDQKFDLAVGESKSYSWFVSIPEDETRTYMLRFIAEGTTHSDGEEMIIPVLANRILVTETMPLPLKANQTKQFQFSEFTKMFQSSTASPHRFVLEYTSHPIWYAIQSLPYLADFPHECSEQLSAKLYANALGSKILKEYPKITSVLKKMSANGSLKSPLEKNPELKSALLEETPWLNDAKSQSEAMKNIALLMDFVKMDAQKKDILQILASRQNGDGSYSWFQGCPPDWYMTQQVLMNISQLVDLKALDANDPIVLSILTKGASYLDFKMNESYRELEKLVEAKKAKWSDQNIGFIHLNQFYLQALWDRVGLKYNEEMTKKARSYYLDQINTYWRNSNIFWEGLCALVLNHKGGSQAKTAQLIVESLRQRALVDDELGMYWRNAWSCYWYNAPVESQALMIEVFNNVAQDKKSVADLKTWLLKNKQTNHWATTKSTTNAIYALLRFGDDWAEELKDCVVKLNDETIKFDESEIGTAYVKREFSKSEIKPGFSRIEVANPNKSVSWGAAYIQYFERLDKVPVAGDNPLNIKKEIYRKKNTDKGPVLTAITDNEKIRRGDIMTSRIIIRTDRDMEYVHLKDMRAAGFEPINQLSGYKWKSGLGYYESPADLATHFFIQWLPKGTYVFEYDTRASQTGEFSNGISSIQSMYASEFAGRSAGIRVMIDK